MIKCISKATTYLPTYKLVQEKKTFGVGGKLTVVNKREVNEVNLQSALT